MVIFEKDEPYSNHGSKGLNKHQDGDRHHKQKNGQRS
jgi:hypothetical protein